MPLYPPAVKMLLPESSTQARIKPIGVILHTNASNRTIEQLFSQFGPGSDQECHFQVEVAPPNGPGRLAQYMDTDRRADNNFQGNSFTRNGVLCGYLSIESADLGQPYTKSWSDLGQRQQLEDLLVWMCQTHSIPTVRPADPWSPGIGYHCMWGFNERGPGNGTYGRFTANDGTTGRLNNPWTNTYGKICPGPAPGTPGGKIGEFNDLLTAVAARVTGEDVVTDDDIKRFWAYNVGTGAAKDRLEYSATAGNQAVAALWGINDPAHLAELDPEVDALTKKVDALTTQVTTLQKSADAILAALEGASIPVSGTVKIG